MKFFALIATVFAASNAYSMDKNLIALSDDFYLDPSAPAHLQVDSVTDTSQCRAQIAKAICVDNGGECDHQAGQTYAPLFEQAFDQMAAPFQKMVCSINTISIEAGLQSTAYASTGGVMGFRKDFVDRPMTYSQWASWKEQLNFGVVTNNNYQYRSDFPTFDVRVPVRGNDMIFTVFTHELGHFMDFAANVQATWAALSWSTNGGAKAGNGFTDQDKICFYSCSSFIPSADIPRMYREMMLNTNYLDLYTARNGYEDFADSIALYTVAAMGGSATMQTGQGEAYSLTNKISSPKFAEKRAYIQNFLARF